MRRPVSTWLCNASLRPLTDANPSALVRFACSRPSTPSFRANSSSSSIGASSSTSDCRASPAIRRAKATDSGIVMGEKCARLLARLGPSVGVPEVTLVVHTKRHRIHSCTGGQRQPGRVARQGCVSQPADKGLSCKAVFNGTCLLHHPVGHGARRCDVPHGFFAGKLALQNPMQKSTRIGGTDAGPPLGVRATAAILVFVAGLYKARASFDVPQAKALLCRPLHLVGFQFAGREPDTVATKATGFAQCLSDVFVCRSAHGRFSGCLVNLDKQASGKQLVDQST